MNELGRARRDSRRPVYLVLLAVMVSLGVGGCQKGGSQKVPPDRVSAGSGNRAWYAGTPEMQRQIRGLVEQIPNIEGAGRIELGRRIVAYGEPAVPQLVEALRAPDPATRGFAAWLLTFPEDPRTIPALIRATGDCSPSVAYDAAATLVRIGEQRGFDRLIAGLSDPDPRLRAKCAAVLQNETGQNFGFKPDDSPSDRAAAVARWRAWRARLPRSCP